MRTTPAEVIDRNRRQVWWTDTTVDDLFRAATAADRGRPAVIDPANRAALGLGEPQRLGYAELDSRIDAIAAQLLGLGLRRGDIVLVQLPNIWEGVALYLVAARLGLVLSPVAMQYRRHELEQIAAIRRREFRSVLLEPAIERSQVGAIGGQRVRRQPPLHPDRIEEPVDRTGAARACDAALGAGDDTGLYCCTHGISRPCVARSMRADTTLRT